MIADGYENEWLVLMNELEAIMTVVRSMYLSKGVARQARRGQKMEGLYFRYRQSVCDLLSS